MTWSLTGLCRGTNATFFFSWDLTPISGLLQRTTMGEHTITFPSDYLVKPLLVGQSATA